MMTLKQIDKKLEALVKLQAFYFGKGQLSNCKLLDRQVSELMQQRNELLDDYAEAITCTNWHYDHHEEASAILELE